MGRRRGSERAATHVAADRAAKEGRVAGSCGHANMWLMYGYIQQGRNSAARRVARQGRMVVEFGPPFVDKPAAELLGETLAAADRHGEAVAAFRTALKNAPNRTAALLGLARVAARAGDPTGSEEAYALLRTIWRRAERAPGDLPRHQ